MRPIIQLSLLAIILFFYSCSSNKTSQQLHGRDVVRMINNYQTDSLQKVMAHAFIMDFDYLSFQATKTNFFEETMPNAKSIGAKYEIIEVKKEGDGSFQYIVKDQSAYEKYLQIEPVKMMLTIAINDSGMVEKIYIDTLSGYHKYDTEFRQKLTGFTGWMEKAHPEDKIQELMEDQSGKMMARLKEYSGKQE
jgi:hypothetical protein